MEQEPKKDPVAVAIAQFEQTIRDIDAQRDKDIAECKRMIENLKKLQKSSSGGKKAYAKGNGQNGHRLGAGRWRGMDKAGAIQAFLAIHNGPVPFEDVMAALRAGGVDLGSDPKRPNRDIANVKTTISQNKRFRWANKKQTAVELVLD